jgi:hypothetical protein
MPSEAEIEAAAHAIACHEDGGRIHPGSSRLTAATISEWHAVAKAVLEAAERIRRQPIETAPSDQKSDACMQAARRIIEAWRAKLGVHT